MNSAIHMILLEKGGQIALCCLLAIVSFCAADEPAPSSRVTTIRDTGRSSPSPYAGAALARPEGWVGVKDGVTDHPFAGDAVICNGTLVMVLRKGGPGAEIYGVGGTEPVMRATLAPASGDAPATIASVKILKNGRSGARMEVSFRAPDGAVRSIVLDLEAERLFVQIEPGEGTEELRVGAPGRFVVLPDFFADDILIDARDLPPGRVELPGEHFLLHLVGNGDGIVTSVRSVAEEDIGISVSGEGDARSFDASRMRFGKDGTIWVAVMEASGIWAAKTIGSKDAGKIIPLGWTQPFPAQWRVDFPRTDRLTDSWEMVSEGEDGKYIKHGWLGGPPGQTLPEDRKRWTTVLGSFTYPCWTDRKGQGFVQPVKLRHKNFTFEGDAVLYPLNRIEKTPLEAYTVVDIMRDTLGVGPCEYVLDVESQDTTTVGMPTCHARQRIKRIYKAGTQVKDRKVVEETLAEVLRFVKFIRGKIETYVAFGKEMQAYLAAQKKARPDLSDFLAEMEHLAKRIDERYAVRERKMKTVEYTAAMIETFRSEMLGYEGEDAAEKAMKFGRDLVEIGSDQDEMVGECRWVVKMLRQRAGIALAVNPEVSEIAREIRDRTREALRNPSGHEAPRH